MPKKDITPSSSENLNSENSDLRPTKSPASLRASTSNSTRDPNLTRVHEHLTSQVIHSTHSSSQGKKKKKESSNEITRTKSAPLGVETLPGICPVVDSSMEKSLQYDATSFMKHFETAFRQVNKNLKTANVLVTGITGAGKSSMINGIFKQKIASTGAGKPVTQDFAKYEVPGHQVAIFDSKGLEQADEDKYISELESFFLKHSVDADGGSVNSIHCVWYVVNASGARIQPYEEYLCQTYFNRYPIIFVLNKVDIAKKEEVDGLVKVIESLGLSNLVGICKTVSDGGKDGKAIIKSIDFCPKCGSDDINISKKVMKATCSECGIQTNLQIDNGLNELIDKTIHVLPLVVREAFVSAQQISFKLKEDKVKLIIKDFFIESKSVSFSKSLVKVIARMLTRISIIWNFKEHGRLCGMHLAQDMVRHASFRDKMFLFMHKHEKEFRHLASLGIVWNRCVRNLALSLCDEFTKEGVNKIESHWHELFERCFKNLSDDEIYKIESDLEEYGLDVILEREMPTQLLTTITTF